MTPSTAFFPCAPVSVRDARRFLRAFLADRRRDDLIEAAELALSEIATNAVLHAHTGFALALALGDDGALRVEVADDNPQLPLRRDHRDQATTGRGMLLVEAVSCAYGVQARGNGKTVWFVVGEEPAGPRAARVPGWDVDQEERPQATTATRRVVLRSLPPLLWLAALEHHDALVRELALHAIEHPELALPHERLAQADNARASILEQVLAELDRVTGPAPGSSSAAGSGQLRRLPAQPLPLDVEITVSTEGAAAFGVLQDVLDGAERLAAAGRLLARPGLPEIVALRDWACEQVIAQHQGVPPSPWPGTEHERFTTEVLDRSGPAGGDWDASTVVEATYGAVAADDANRILAVSRPLAEWLGWRVEDLVGRRIVALVPPELREAHVAGFTRHLATGETHVVGVPLRLPVLRRDGTRIHCHVLIEQATAAGRGIYLARIDPADQAAAPA